MAENMDLWIEKANVLVEALPYIREFNGKKIVVKYGGSAMTDSHLKKSVITDVALLKLIGMKPIIVHGGGKEISKWVRLSGQTPQFVNGLRVTDKSTMEIAEMVLGKVNKGLVQYMEENGVKACGISGKDGGTMRVVKKQLASGQDIGFVGEVTKVDTSLIDTLLDQDFIPVICPIGLGEEESARSVSERRISNPTMSTRTTRPARSPWQRRPISLPFFQILRESMRIRTIRRRSFPS